MPLDTSMAATIAGSIGGGLVALLLSIALGLFLVRKYRQKQSAHYVDKSIVPLASGPMQSSGYAAAPPLQQQRGQYDDVNAVRPPNEYDSPSSPFTF